MARRSDRDRRNARSAASISAAKKRHASQRLKERVGDMNFAEFRESILDDGVFLKLAEQENGAWLCHARHEDKNVYFILKRSDRGRGRGQEIATILTKPMAMHNFPHVFGSDGNHQTPQQREQREKKLQQLDVLEQKHLQRRKALEQDYTHQLDVLEQKHLQECGALEKENRELWRRKVELEETTGRLRRQLAEEQQKKPKSWWSRLFGSDK